MHCHDSAVGKTKVKKVLNNFLNKLHITSPPCISTVGSVGAVPEDPRIPCGGAWNTLYNQ